MIDLEQMRQRAALCAEVTLPGEMLRELLDHIAELEAEVESYRCGNGGIVVVSRTDKDPAARGGGGAAARGIE